MKQLTVFALSMLVTVDTLAGPFGLEMGMTLAQLRAAGVEVGQQTGPILKTAKVPRPHPAFESYSLLVDDKVGLCKVIATGKNISMNSFGTQLVDEFNTLRSGLDEIYGPSKTNDYLRAGSAWSDPQDWSTALVKKERMLESYWGTLFSNEQFTPKDGIETVGLSARATSPSTGYLMLHYEFKGVQACIDRTNKKRNAVL